MVSVVPRSFSMPSPTAKQELQLNELGSLTDAVEPFARLLSQTGRSVRLHCSVPMWSSPSDTCLDLHDLHDLRSRILLFVHDLLESLHSAGISASYRLAPSNSSLCFICALPTELSAPKVRSAAVEILQNANIHAREKVLLADLECGPALIIS
ncbi:uncharacterized protein F5891DRAFT_1040268 [Suillus fuscotomentosus]|uniref:Uncharacterized protein n=1 Tax=Suillus fuscotomentosus TaxID=1912939 RepID=A0AAD4E6I8_9AGAM|nr:uncharacterized protein F5891DRAFT_1040268 [Suillus fuscotomentosus]KAG1833798.1 hypothetical protein EV424DRAFT_846703 [Suillus variegatus]KAG1899238.1 hypothetical protein F5891DRAFT_1040268 [Suillus fuscotomentosus]